jgi:hypothetical protein
MVETNKQTNKHEIVIFRLGYPDIKRNYQDQKWRCMPVLMAVQVTETVWAP